MQILTIVFARKLVGVWPFCLFALFSLAFSRQNLTLVRDQYLASLFLVGFFLFIMKPIALWYESRFTTERHCKIVLARRSKALTFHFKSNCVNEGFLQLHLLFALSYSVSQKHRNFQESQKEGSSRNETWSEKSCGKRCGKVSGMCSLKII